MTPALGVICLWMGLLTIGQCWVPGLGAALVTKHGGGYRDDVRQQKISAFRCRTFPSPTLVNTQPWSLDGDKGLQRWP